MSCRNAISRGFVFILVTIVGAILLALCRDDFDAVTAAPLPLTSAAMVVAMSHGGLRGGGGVAASYSRFSSELQSSESLAEQRHACREAAAKNGHRLPPELEFSDEAVSGTVLAREGFQAVLHAAREARIKALYVYNLSRLARESVIGMPALKDLVHNGVRVISVAEGRHDTVPLPRAIHQNTR